MIKALLLAEQCDPASVSVPLEGWSHSRAISELPGVIAHTATQIRSHASVLRAGSDPTQFTFIDSEPVARPMWKLAQILRGGAGKGWTTVTAISAVSYAYFERLLWRRLGRSIANGAFDVVHRITPLSPTLPSMIATRCRHSSVPFVLGPLNGGVPWPRQFETARRREREWLSYIRGAYRLLPGYRSTREAASAIIVGSVDTLRQEPDRFRGKCVYIPENGFDPSRFSGHSIVRDPASPMRVAFVGRLVPYKGADILIDAAAPLIRSGALVLDIIGDGPDRPRIDDLVKRYQLEPGVELPGWIPHSHLRERLGRAHVFGFPSVREFGGAVVVEAMALGLVPIVMSYGGPGEIVTSATGFALPMASRAEVIQRLRATLAHLAERPTLVNAMGERARARVFRSFTWEAKARQVYEVYQWVLGIRRERPNFGMPLPDLPTADSGADVVQAPLQTETG